MRWDTGWHRRTSRGGALTAALALGAVLALPAAALGDHGPTRAGSDPCNGSDAFGLEQVATHDVVDAIVAQNPGARRADGTIDRSKINHALLRLSAHVAVQVVAKPGHPLGHVLIEVRDTDANWTFDSTNHPHYVTGADGHESDSRDIDSDTVMGGAFAFFPATDIFPDGNFVARIRAMAPDGSEAGRFCAEVTLHNGMSPADAFAASADPAFEPPVNRVPGQGIAPQPIVWFPAAEPFESQRGTYDARTARIEFPYHLESVSVQRRRRVACRAPCRARSRWVSYTRSLERDDFRRTHSLTGRYADDAGYGDVPGLTNRKVLGPGYRLSIGSAPRRRLPAELLRVKARDVAGRRFCGVWRIVGGPNGSFHAGVPERC